MNLLSWVRGKTKQTNADPLKDFSLGSYGCMRSSSKVFTLPDNVYQNSLSGRQGHLKTEENLEEEDEFEGFLAIGTLGTEPPATPKLFATSLEDEFEEKEDITKYELKVISEKLEKFLESETEQRQNPSLNRKSIDAGHILDFPDSSSFKISAEESDTEETGLWPLQGYLLGSSIEIPKTEDEEVKKTKRSVAAELLQRKKPVEGSSDRKRDPIKRIMKKLRELPKKSPAGFTKDDDSLPKKNKFRKISKIFHRKIHPVFYTSEDESKETKKEYKIGHRSFYIETDLGGDNEASRSSEGFLNSRPSSYVAPLYEIVGKNSRGKREKWINTDAEYLVLEL